MKVNLIKEAEYEIDVEKCSEIPLQTFMKMSNTKINVKTNGLPDALVFTSIDEFKAYQHNENFDENKNVLVMNNGRIFVFLKKDVCVSDESTDTKENTDKKA